ncbi:MAG: hypothetical protein H7061_06505 [Bdellovibrionaceae bacterium]|nr:hypothetical protein [Bdellovibrio sp.]
MDIKNIASLESISGTILTENSDGQRTQIITNVFISKENFKIIYFDEVPLMLKASEANLNQKLRPNAIKCDDDDKSASCQTPPTHSCPRGRKCEF